MPVFVPVNAGMFPIPLPGNPMPGWVFTQLYTIVLAGKPELGLLKVIAFVNVAAQSSWLVTALTVAVGFTDILNVVGVPVQVVPALVKVGVTVMLPVIGFAVALVTVNGAILPVPLAARPIPVLSFTQL